MASLYKRKITRGQSYDLTVDYEENGANVSIVGDTLYLTTKPTQFDDDVTDSAAIVSKTVVVPNNPDALVGQYTFNLGYSDTYHEPGTYYTDVFIKRISTGKRYPLTLEKLVITGTPTNRNT